MYRSFLVLLCLAVAGSANLVAPRIGFARFGEAALRPVYGVPESFTVGQPIAEAVKAVSFSAEGGIVALHGSIRLVQPDGRVLAEHPTTERDAVLGIGASLSSALAWLPDSDTLVHFDGAEFKALVLPAPLPGRVLSLYASDGTAMLLVEQERSVSEIKISLRSGALLAQEFLPEVHAPAIYIRDGILYEGERELVFRDANQVYKLPFVTQDITFERMANGWAHAIKAGTNKSWAVQISKTRLSASELPVPFGGKQ